MNPSLDVSGLAADLLAALFPHIGGELGPHTQATRLLRLHTPLGPDQLLAERVWVTEAIGPDDGLGPRAGLHIRLHALAADAHLELKRLIGQPVLLALLPQHSRTALRPWHGHVSGVALLGSDGGLARYELTIEPWLAWLGQRRDSRVFQGLGVPEIVDAVFEGYQAQGRLQPDWRWDLADPAVYPRRSLCIQYQETDLAFVQRLLREEGLVCWWTHEGDAASLGLGRHTLVIADHASAVPTNQDGRLRYTQSGVALPQDSLTRWRRSRHARAAGFSLASRDDRSRSLRPAAQSGVELRLPALGQHDVPGLYAYEDPAQGERLARVQAEAFDAARERVEAEGPWRCAEAGTRFTLTDHPVHDGSDAARDEFIVLRVEHRARNNLQADHQAAVDALLGSPERCQGERPANAGDEPLHTSRLLAQPARLPLRRAPCDAEGRPDPRLHTRPTVVGVQTALVVGLDAPVHTDRDHRIRIQFHWQRGGRASHRLYRPDGADEAPASDASGTWVRVAESVAGANWGSNFTPRLGQEVLVGFVAGDIDRPVVLGALYNGIGAEEAQGNQVPAGAAGAVGSAPVWFPGQRREGELPGHQHAQVFTGYKSQALATTASGFGGHNQLVLDDSPGEGRIELFSSSAQTRLQLGHLRHQIDNRRLQPRGHGADLATAAWGAVRAGSGLLLSTWPRPGSTQAGRQLDAAEALQQLDEGRQLLHTLAESAQQHGAKTPTEPDTLGAQRPERPRLLPAERGLAATLDSLEATATRGAPEGSDTEIGGGAGTVPAWGRPDLLFSAPAGVAGLTPASTVWTSGATLAMSAAQDIASLAQGHHATVVKGAAILYTHGSKTLPGKPNQETGLRIHAASGNLQTQSQTGPSEFTADQRVHFAAVGGTLTLAAPGHVLLAAAGAAIRMEGGRISCTGPGSIYYKASLKVFDSPGANVPYGFELLPRPDPLKPTDLEFRRTYADGSPIPALPYTVTLSDGSQRRGRTDASGLVREAGVPHGTASVVYGLDPNPPAASVTLEVDDDFGRLFAAGGTAA